MRILGDTEELKHTDLIFTQKQYDATNEVLSEKLRTVMDALKKSSTS